MAESIDDRPREEKKCSGQERHRQVAFTKRLLAEKDFSG
jgi:hypothetical protein